MLYSFAFMQSLRLVRLQCGSRFGSTLVAVIVSLMVGASASAAPIFVTFAGTVTVSTTPGIDVGTAYSGKVLYDTSDPMLWPAPAEFYSFGTTDMLSITIGNCTFAGSGPGTFFLPNGLGVRHNQVFNGQSAGDLFEAIVNSSATSNCAAFSPYELFFEIVGPPGLLIGNGIPSSFDLSKVVQPSFSGYGTGAGAFFAGNQLFLGNLTSIEVAAVPEPSTGILLSSILCGFVLALRCLPCVGHSRGPTFRA